ncbi:MAG: hypothetical protein UT55_C0033G0009 [Candidatus Peregrinibacteria bacterium GW2011_GWE2_39_6]|nr:MAG: hypothetical protein UT36_C0001G0175 [Candidatus Peregrinibacteria bacterium GW2011_GWF2_39_17]KKR25685.1 MAG: hypothetical protein UT55_C0033G0009 [Candidatus Peregrinibacteria bacterium GW2011_GWE2_39_6]HCW32613.1 hypothetical protein [Candidatus Peregrinibacteria bacterium]
MKNPQSEINFSIPAIATILALSGVACTPRVLNPDEKIESLSVGDVRAEVNRLARICEATTTAPATPDYADEMLGKSCNNIKLPRSKSDISQPPVSFANGGLRSVWDTNNNPITYSHSVCYPYTGGAYQPQLACSCITLPETGTTTCYGTWSSTSKRYNTAAIQVAPNSAEVKVIDKNGNVTTWPDRHGRSRKKVLSTAGNLLDRVASPKMTTGRPNSNDFENFTKRRRAVLRSWK